eukprot:ANDGO_07678.mRNA.1 hypothetical protein
MAGTPRSAKKTQNLADSTATAFAALAKQENSRPSHSSATTAAGLSSPSSSSSSSLVSPAVDKSGVSEAEQRMDFIARVQRTREALAELQNLCKTISVDQDKRDKLQLVLQQLESFREDTDLQIKQEATIIVRERTPRCEKACLTLILSFACIVLVAFLLLKLPFARRFYSAEIVHPF